MCQVAQVSVDQRFKQKLSRYACVYLPAPHLVLLSTTTRYTVIFTASVCHLILSNCTTHRYSDNILYCNLLQHNCNSGLIPLTLNRGTLRICTYSVIVVVIHLLALLFPFLLFLMLPCCNIQRNKTTQKLQLIRVPYQCPATQLKLKEKHHSFSCLTTVPHEFDPFHSGYFDSPLLPR